VETEARPGAVSGKVVVIIFVIVVASVVGALVWYKSRPQTLPPALNEENGVMLLIPAGPFRHGAENIEAAAAPPFYMDRIEVTNRLFGKFCAATGHPLPPDFPPDRPEDPVVNVTIEDATLFAKWAGKRLPNALEWEKAYRGPNGRKYPWGDDPDPVRAVVSDNLKLAEHKVMPADSWPEGGSPYNILHMAGNVAEYVRTLNPPTPADIERMSRLVTPPPTARDLWYQIKGGSFNQPLEAALPWKSTAVPVTFRAPSVGFRCVKDHP
jgi:formylglycine-generating enzyme required for sulfatase activity